MTAPVFEMTPMQYLVDADRELASGNHRQAALLIWKATEATFVGLAHSRGLVSDDLIILAKALEVDNPDAKGYYRGSLITGKLLLDHAEMGVLESYELEDAYEGAREFVRQCQSDQRQ